MYVLPVPFNIPTLLVLWPPIILPDAHQHQEQHKQSTPSDDHIHRTPAQHILYKNHNCSTHVQQQDQDTGTHSFLDRVNQFRGQFVKQR